MSEECVHEENVVADFVYKKKNSCIVYKSGPVDRAYIIGICVVYSRQ